MVQSAHSDTYTSASCLPLEAQSNDVHDVDVRRQEEARGALEPERHRGEGEGAPDVHGVAEDVEGEALDAVVHEDAEVVAEEGARNAEGVGRGDHESLTGGEEGDGDDGVEGRGQNRLLGLVLECALEAGTTCQLVVDVGGRMGRTASRGAYPRRRWRARGNSSPCAHSPQISG